MAEPQKVPSLDMKQLQSSVTRAEFMGKMEDFRDEMRRLSEVIFEVKTLNGDLYMRIEKLEKHVDNLKKKNAKE